MQRSPSYLLAPEEHLKDAWRSKLLRKSIGQFRVTDVRGDVVTIDQDGVRQPMSIDRVTPAQT